MKRKWIQLDKVAIYDEMHVLQPDGTFVVDETKDGQTTEQHREGIDYIKSVIQNGQKVLPPLVVEHSWGEYTRLDGFKRCLAFKELGFEQIEAFVCDEEEYRQALYVPFRDGKMRCWKGGQYDDENNRKFPLFEGGETDEFNYDDVKFLYKSPNGDGLRIELCECIHVHFGLCGQYRFALGRKDFEQLAEAISKI